MNEVKLLIEVTIIQLDIPDETGDLSNRILDSIVIDDLSELKEKLSPTMKTSFYYVWIKYDRKQ